MTKKLLMNNYSENGLMPVMDGLICWLDARDIQNGNTVWVDRSGNGNNGLLRGFTFDGQTNGKVRNSLLFDGQKCNVLIEMKAAPLFTGNKFSIQVNAKIPPHSHSQKLFHRRDTGGGRYFIMSIASSGGSVPDVNNDIGNKIQFVSHAYGISNHGIISKREVIDNTIKDIFVTSDGVNVKLYIDQDTNYTKSLAGVHFNDNNPFILIGSSGDRDRLTTPEGQRSKFKYNSLKIYNRALTEEEIQQNYLYEQSIEREICAENVIEWDYEKTSEQPILIQELWKEYFDRTNINLNLFSNNQILEVDISSVTSGENAPQIMLLCNSGIGGKVYWDGTYGATLKMGNNPNFVLQLTYPVKLRVALINNTFSLYINDILQDSVNAYPSVWLPFTGIQIKGQRMLATAIRYKKID